MHLVRFRRNFGQTAAMAAGFDRAQGAYIVPMDADLQNDPSDIPLLLSRLEEGYDVVSGWRKDRQDKALTRRLPSRIANWLIGVVGGLPLHDYGCTLKAYRREVLEPVKLYGEMHRFIPIYAKSASASTGKTREPDVASVVDLRQKQTGCGRREFGRQVGFRLQQTRHVLG